MEAILLWLWHCTVIPKHRGCRRSFPKYSFLHCKAAKWRMRYRRLLLPLVVTQAEHPCRSPSLQKRALGGGDSFYAAFVKAVGSFQAFICEWLTHGSNEDRMGTKSHGSVAFSSSAQWHTSSPQPHSTEWQSTTIPVNGKNPFSTTVPRRGAYRAW